LKDAGAGNGSDNVHQLETPESSVHRVPMPWMKTNNNSLVTPESDSLASSVVKGSGVGVSEENTRKAAAPYSDVHMISISTAMGVS